jgi:hypothetical protein
LGKGGRAFHIEKHIVALHIVGNAGLDIGHLADLGAISNMI